MALPSWFSANYIFSGSGNSCVFGTLGNDFIKDTSGNDKIVGDPLFNYNYKTFSLTSEGEQYCYEFGGNDTIKANSGNDLIYGDSAIGFNTAAQLSTSLFDYNSGGNDSICAGSGDDTIYGDSEFIRTPGGEESFSLTSREILLDSSEGGESQGGNDTIYGESGNDLIYAGGGKDYVNGGSGNDLIYGGDGSDTINGDTGNDTIVADGGYDYLSGGLSGVDVFVFTCETDGATITDFQKAIDKIDLSEFGSLGFADLTLTVANGDTTVHVPEAGGFDIFLDNVTGVTASSFIFSL